MIKHSRIKLVAVACVACLMALALCSCGNSNKSSASQEVAEVPEHQVAREDVEKVLYKAADNTFTSVNVTTKTETSATGAASSGQQTTQTIKTATKGQLDGTGEKPKLHMDYEAQSNMELGKTSYEMFIDKDNLIVKQKEQLYVDAMSDETLDSYAKSVTSVLSTDEIKTMLDMASDYTIQEHEGDTTVTITVDKNKLLASEMVDDSSLPTNTEIATMVISYTVDSDDRFKSVRIMSSTSGSPTYRVSQTYEFSGYDKVTLPEWPDLNAYMAEMSGIKTDENGRMYIDGEDGQRYYVTEIGDDGMIYYETGSNASTGGYTENATPVYVETEQSVSSETQTTEGGTAGSGTNAGTGGTSGTSGSSNSAGSSSDTSNQGRAYITAADGTIHYLDEPGSEIRDLGGATVFIDANGEWYFLDFGNGE